MLAVVHGGDQHGRATDGVLAEDVVGAHSGFRTPLAPAFAVHCAPDGQSGGDSYAHERTEDLAHGPHG